MAFYKYWMVYLPEFNRESFLLFVHNPAGLTKLRDYSSGKEIVLGQPRWEGTLGNTELGQTRFQVDPHPITDDRYWRLRTTEHNSRYLSLARRIPVSGIVSTPEGPPGVAHVGNVTCGRAHRGSRKQLQDYVNQHEDILTAAVIKALPERLQELGAHIRWVSPISKDNYAEYRDADFLRAVGLGDCARELAAFWPSGGPSWDALAIVSDSNGRIRPGVILVEAKSHIPEIYGNGCQAIQHSRGVIEKSLAVAKEWCHARPDCDWTGPFYQSANRLAHLWFIRERLKHTAWLVNLYFIDDPIGPVNRSAWEAELLKVKRSLGVSTSVPFTIDLFLPALTSGKDEQYKDLHDDGETVLSKVNVSENEVEASHASSESAGDRQISVLPESETFAAWANQWMALAGYDGALIPDVPKRIENVVCQWRKAIPGSWRRGLDPQLLDRRYRRGDINSPHRGEHAIEYAVLCRHFERVSCFGNKLLDGVNALPLVRDAGGGRSANVEADMLLLAGEEGRYRLFLCEVKAESNNAWYAAVESARQLRLLTSSSEFLSLCLRRNPLLCLPADLPVTAVVIAPYSFYASPGKRANSVEPALKLLARLRAEFSVDIQLAVWDESRLSIDPISSVRDNLKID